MHKDMVRPVLILDGAWHYPPCSHCYLIYLELNAVKVSNKFGKNLFELICISEAPYDGMMILWLQGQVSRRLFSVPSTQLVYMPPMIPNIAMPCAIVVYLSSESIIWLADCAFSHHLYTPCTDSFGARPGVFWHELSVWLLEGSSCQ